MGAESGGRGSDLSEALRKSARRFNLFQAVRLLRRIGGGGGPGVRSFGVRFRTSPKSVFPAAAVQSAEPPGNGASGEWTLNVAAFGLVGAAGAMPRRYTEELAQRAAEERPEDYARRGEATNAFFDIFNQRMLELYYLAWERGKFHVKHENGDDRSPARQLLALAGLGGSEPTTPDRSGRCLTADAAAFFAGLLGQTPRSAQAAAQVLASVLNAPVTVTPFDGGWLRLPEETRLRLGRSQDRRKPKLGEQALGCWAWDRGSTIRMRIGPLHWDRFTALLPDESGTSPALDALKAATAALLGVNMRIRLQLVLRGDETPLPRLGGGKSGGETLPGPALGRSCWLPGRPPDRDADETLLDCV